MGIQYNMFDCCRIFEIHLCQCSMASFVLVLHYRCIGHNLRYTRHDFSLRLGDYRGNSRAIICMECYTMCSQ